MGQVAKWHVQLTKTAEGKADWTTTCRQLEATLDNVRRRLLKTQMKRCRLSGHEDPVPWPHNTKRLSRYSRRKS